jgi:hypothetical protein
MRRITDRKISRVLRESLSRFLNEDVLGDNWHEKEVDDILGITNTPDNQHPFADQLEDGSHEWSIQGEYDDPTIYGQEYDAMDLNAADSDFELYRGI